MVFPWFSAPRPAKGPAPGQPLGRSRGLGPDALRGANADGSAAGRRVEAALGGRVWPLKHRKSLGKPWDLMGFHGILWDFMGFYGILCDFMGYTLC